MSLPHEPPELNYIVLTGKVTEKGDGRVILASRIGARRILDLPAGEQLPRIC